MINNSSLKEFSDLIADDRQSVPAGGSTIASTALLGTSLLELVIKVSDLAKPQLQKELKKIKSNLENKITEDTEAFLLNQNNNFKENNDLKKLITVPWKIVNNSSQALTIANKINTQVKENVQADYYIARLNLKLAIKGGVEIIEANYQFFSEDSPFINAMQNKIAAKKRTLDNSGNY